MTKAAVLIKNIKKLSSPPPQPPPSTKQSKDYISETISFVIKGQLTPIKPIISKPKMSAKKSKKSTENKKQQQQKSPTKKIKKSVVANIKNKIGSKKQTTKKTVTVSETIIKKETTKKKIQKKPKPDVVKKIKTPTKKGAFNSIVSKRGKNDKSKNSSKETEQNKKNEDLKTKQTIEKLLKQANKALKQPQIKSQLKFNTLKKKPKQTDVNNSKQKKVKLLTSTQQQSPSSSSAVTTTTTTRTITTPPPPTTNKTKQIKEKIKKQIKRKMSNDESNDTSTSDDITLNELRKTPETKMKKLKIKKEPTSLENSNKKITKTIKKKLPTKSNLVLMKKRLLTKSKIKTKQKDNQRNNKIKLLGFWNGPKRRRVASLNALAKVHCLYENETRATLLDPVETPKKEIIDDKSDTETITTRTLRSVPGLRAVGKHWDMHDSTSSSEDTSESSGEVEEKPKPKKEIIKRNKKTEQKKRRNRNELIMDLKDMVVRKRMASLNASAILAASYSTDKRSKNSRSDDDEDDDDDDDENSESDDSSDYFVRSAGDNLKKDFDSDIKKEDAKMLEVKSPNHKMAVILNQDTDVTITGVYVNSTTRSTHHEGYCSIAGMQYRISATSHTQTAATAVATETLLQSSSSSTQDNSNSESLPSCKSYTPLDALSNMQPPPGPGIQHPHQHLGPPQHILPLPPHQLSPSRRHGCSSAFSTPYPPAHHHPTDQPYIHGYYQPAGPLISVPHAHAQPTTAPLTKSSPLSETSPPASASPTNQAPPPPPPSSNGDSSDSEVIITSVTAAKESLPPPQAPATAYRYAQYPAAPPGYSYTYPHYYPTPPPAPSYPHHELCYPPSPYLHPKYPPTYRRYLTNTQFYTTPAPPPPPPGNVELFTNPATSGTVQASQQVVTTTPVASSSSAPGTFPVSTAGGGALPTILETYPPPPPPTLVETYPHPAHYYPGYGPSCYTHSPPSRSIPFINTAYQSCPCPMQSCPKNVLTGPLTGDSKRSINLTSISKNSMPLPPVALALPLEPASATGPPSPARGSAGMPPPPSPAGATYQSSPLITTLTTTITTPTTTITATTSTTKQTPKQESSTSPDTTQQDYFNSLHEKKRKARIGKAMVRNNIAAIQQNTMLLMCNPSTTVTTTTATTIMSTPKNFIGEVKREIESPKEKETNEDMKSLSLLEKSSQNNDVISLGQQLKKENDEKLNNTITNQQAPLSSLVTSTVAENVKMKNMKRKLSVTKDKNDKNELSSPNKKNKIENKFNGSYKDLIKKDTNSIKIKFNNGKRKLITENKEQSKSSLKSSTLSALSIETTTATTTTTTTTTTPKTTTAVATATATTTTTTTTTTTATTTITTTGKLKTKTKKPTKRKLSSTAATTTTKIDLDHHNKRTKSTKPLSVLNNNNSKVIKEKEKISNDKCLENENREPPKRKKTNFKNNNNNNNNNNEDDNKSTTTTSADQLDILINKNNIDRTIESVISDLKVRTTKDNNSAVNNSNNSNKKTIVNKKSTKNNGQVKNNAKMICTINSNNNNNNNNNNLINNNDNNNNSNINNNNNNNNNRNNKKCVIGGRRKSKCKEKEVVQQVLTARIPRRSLHLPKWSNGWTWEGNSYEAKVFLNSDETTVLRNCYSSMRHIEGDTIEVRDCVLLKAGPRKNDLPFVAKIAALWENPDDGEMMMSLLWYYRPEHTEQGRLPTDQPDEVFASRHKDSNSVACIDDKCYVITFSEYCRYRKKLKCLEEGFEQPKSRIPIPEIYPRQKRQPPHPLQVSSDMVFFCRRVYDFRQKRIVKNPS